MKIKKLLYVVVLSLCFTSCITDVKTEDINTDINLESSLVLPIGSVHANMLYLLDIIDSTYLSTDSTNAICLLYNQENIDLAVNLDTSFRKGEYLAETLTLKTQPCFDAIFGELPPNIESIPLPSGNYKFSRKTKYNLDFNKNTPEEIIKIDSARIQQANVDFKIRVEGITLSEDNFLIMSFHYPELLDDEYDHTFEDIIITTNSYSLSETLNRFMAKFNKLEEENLIDLQIDFNLISKGTTNISIDTKLFFETQINLINTHEVYGFVWYRDPVDAGNVSYEIPQDIFENELLANNNLLFTNPEVIITTTTNAGLPLRLELNNVYATKGERKEYASFNGERFTVRDLVIPERPFDSATTTIAINREYGSLHTLLSMLPETINLDYKVTTPQKEKIENRPQFLTLPLLAKLDIQAKIPLQFDPTTNFSYKDTLDADFSSLFGEEILNTINLDTITLYLDINNALPVNARLKLYYLDNNDEIISETQQFTISSAIVDSEGRVKTPTQQELILSTIGDAINDVYNTKKIIIDIAVDGYNEQSMIYFESTNAIDIKIGAFAKVGTSISFNK